MGRATERNDQRCPVRELQRAGHYEHVYALASDVHGDYVLRGRLYDFREVDKNELSARVAFDFELRDSGREPLSGTTRTPTTNP